MILYLDASALVKRYVAERYSRETADLCGKAAIVATSLVTRAEVAAALAKAELPPERIEEFERAMDAMDAELPPLRAFVLPAGTPQAAAMLGFAWGGAAIDPVHPQDWWLAR